MEYNYSSLEEALLLSFARAHSQQGIKLYHDQEKQTNLHIHLEPHDYQVTLIYIISMEFLSLPRRRPSWKNKPNGEEQGETAVFAG